MADRFSAAVAFAGALHRGQHRKSNGSPYFSHLLAVTALVMAAGGDEDECIAALLHDAVEDQGGARTAEEIRRRFGDRVADIVLECSEKREPGCSWIDRKRNSLQSVSSATSSARLVLSADKLHNVRSLISDYRVGGESIWERFRGKRDGTLWYYRSMADEIESAGGSALQGDLEDAVRGLELVARGKGLRPAT
ncbi:MAG: HD domain-containing protein [Bryobacterales bacterium]|nr:HD domain-containing protein [Bryobacterales bacterium]